MAASTSVRIELVGSLIIVRCFLLKNDLGSIGYCGAGIRISDNYSECFLSEQSEKEVVTSSKDRVRCVVSVNYRDIALVKPPISHVAITVSPWAINLSNVRYFGTLGSTWLSL